MNRFNFHFVEGGILFSVNEANKACVAEIGYRKVRNNNRAFKKMELPEEVYFGDKITEESFNRLNDLKMLRKAKTDKFSQGFLDYIAFSKAFEHHNKLLMFNSKNNGSVFVYTQLNEDTRKVDLYAFIIRGVKESDFSKYYRGGIDKTMWFYHKKTTQKQLKKIRKFSWTKNDLYEDLERLSIDEIERALLLFDDEIEERIYDKIIEYMDSL